MTDQGRPSIEAISENITTVCNISVESLLFSMESFHVAWLASETALNEKVPNQTESREVSEVLFNIISRDLAEIETLLFPNIHPFLTSDERYLQTRHLFFTRTTQAQKGLEGTMNAPNN